MNYSEIVLLAFALSIDVCVVSFSYGLCIENRHRYNAFILALTTGLFHTGMPILGHYFTDLVRGFIAPYSQWIVFFIFAYLGFTFIVDAYKNDEQKSVCLNIKNLILISIATSIDVFSAGISLSLMGSPMKFAVLTMGAMTFVNSLIGYYAGFRSKIFKAKYLEILGGLILIFLAVKSFY